jgi:uncharacterized DUF497 family protein
VDFLSPNFLDKRKLSVYTGNIHCIHIIWIYQNWRDLIKHSVSNEECEECFENIPIYFFPDTKHSSYENRLGLFGKTHKGRFLTLVFTIRKNNIRVISARDQNRKEKNFYIQYEKETL